jgi:hypothetical protein
MSAIPAADVVHRMALYTESVTNKNVIPENEALWFYGMNHGMALISQNFDPLEPLPPEELEFVKNYHAQMTEKSARAFYYLLIICVREARHCKNLSDKFDEIKAKFGAPMANFMKNSKGEHGIHENLKNSPPNTTIGNLTKCVQWMFYNCSWPGGYGGKAWGKVTDCLVNFVTGTFSAEMMLDTIWTLSHNNGPIFNKGHLYGMYNGDKLIRLLDIQRSGQIPTAVIYDKKLNPFVDDQLESLMKRLIDKYDLPRHVCWYTVEQLGSVKMYPSDKLMQAEKYGVPEHAAEAEKQAAIAAQAAAKKAAEQEAIAEAKAKAEAEEFAKTHLEIYPGFHVKKILRAA